MFDGRVLADLLTLLIADHGEIWPPSKSGGYVGSATSSLHYSNADDAGLYEQCGHTVATMRQSWCLGVVGCMHAVMHVFGFATTAFCPVCG